MGTFVRNFLARRGARWCTFFLISLFIPAGSWAQDVANGEKVFKKCTACHTVGKGAKNKVGPALSGVVGRAAGQADGYIYSKAMRDSGITWDEATLSAYLRNPKNSVKGTKMMFAGLKKDSDVVAVIAYLKGFGPDGAKR